MMYILFIYFVAISNQTHFKVKLKHIEHVFKLNKGKS
jgi:hypothetical protein